jgi:membrane protein YqaA with SNARE-associated domain
MLATLIGSLLGYLLGCFIIEISGIDYEYATTYKSTKQMLPWIIIFSTTVAGGLIGLVLSS